MVDSLEHEAPKSPTASDAGDSGWLGKFSDYSDLSGAKCALKPQRGEFSILTGERASNDCSYSKSAAGTSQEALQEFFERASKETSHLYSPLGFGIDVVGTGVTIANSKSQECLVVTDRHNVKGTADQENNVEMVAMVFDRDVPPPSASVMFQNGKSYSADVPVLDEARDVAVLRVHTGADTNEVCHPASFAASSAEIKNGDTVLSIGFPDFVQNPYISVGTFMRNTSLDKTDASDPGIGEDAKRPIYQHTLATRHGSSGGGLYNISNQVLGLLSRGNNAENSYSTPLTQLDINQLIEQANSVSATRKE